MTAASGPVGLISNPASGHNRDQFERIHERIARCGAIHHVVTHSAADVPAALAEMAARGVTVLAINGGDGTASLYAAGGKAVQDHVVLAGERIKIVIASGGNAKSGTFTVIYG